MGRTYPGPGVDDRPRRRVRSPGGPPHGPPNPL